MSEDQHQITKVIRFGSRHLRLLLVCLLCGLTAGLAWYLYSSKVYRASSLIMYQQNQISSTRVSPEIQSRVQEMINTVSQQVTSRSNLEEIIVAHGLYPELRQRQPMDDVVIAMRNQDIKIELQRGADVFQVAYIGSDPRQVMLTTNALAAKFIEENIRFREQRVTETLAYIRDELAVAKTSLDQKEKSMRDYKVRYFNEMPEQQAANIARLSTLQSQGQHIQNSVQELKRTQLLVQEQIGLRQDMLARMTEGYSGPAVEPPRSELDLVRRELEQLQSRYTANHPDVQRLQSRFETLQVRLDRSPEAAAGGEETRLTGQGVGLPDSQLAQLRLQLNEIDHSLTRLARDQETGRRQIEQVQGWVEMAPVREAEWAALTRDYDQLQQHYQALVGRSLEAESAEMLERRQKGSQFRVIEPAFMPNKPFSPNFKKIMALAVALSLGLGLGLAAFFTALNTSFREVDDLEGDLGLPVSCAIPVLATAAEKRRERWLNLAWIIGLGGGFALLIGAMVLMVLRGTIIF